MQVRNAIYEDCERLLVISQNDLGYTDCTLENLQTQFKKLDSKREQVFVVEIEGTVAGFIHVAKYDVLYAEPLVNVLGLAVDSNYRRQGIGRTLLLKAEEWGKSVGAKAIRLNSGESRTEAHKFYRMQGYDMERLQKRFMKYLK